MPVFRRCYHINRCPKLRRDFHISSSAKLNGSVMWSPPLAAGHHPGGRVDVCGGFVVFLCRGAAENTGAIRRVRNAVQVENARVYAVVKAGCIVEQAFDVSLPFRFQRKECGKCGVAIRIVHIGFQTIPRLPPPLMGTRQASSICFSNGSARMAKSKFGAFVQADCGCDSDLSRCGPSVCRVRRSVS